MAQNFVKLQTKLLREYYKDFSKYAKGKSPEHKVAWVTAFTPVEILEALNIDYYYPESYAAVIAASEMEQSFIIKSTDSQLSQDCCSYSCCFNGALDMSDGPRGVPPKPDVLIATNNQCNTLPNWWNILSKRYDVPLIVIDYPGESSKIDKMDVFDYVTRQHKNLVNKLEEMSGKIVDIQAVERLIGNSKESIRAWKRVADSLSYKMIKPTTLFDNINFLITARCKKETSEMYNIFYDALGKERNYEGEELPVFWLGYPLWYHSDRILSEVLDGLKVVGSNYLTWWNLEYAGNDVWEQLFTAYNYTFLNLKQESRDERLKNIINRSGAKGAIVLHNKSCKCDFVSAKNIDIPQAEIEIDMIDRNFLDIDKARKKMELLREIICTE